MYERVFVEFNMALAILALFFVLNVLVETKIQNKQHN
jgi:hypothetical protein